MRPIGDFYMLFELPFCDLHFQYKPEILDSGIGWGCRHAI